jgi:TonB family protein
MKLPVSYAQPRRLAARKKQVRLDLRRATPPSPDNELLDQHQGTFWKWFALVALFHVIAICLFGLFYAMTPAPKPPEPYLNLMPEGSTVNGTPGVQAAPKISQATQAPAVHHTQPPEPITPVQPQPVKPPPQVAIAPQLPKPIVKADLQPVLREKPITPPKPKVKVDLKLADGPTPVVEKPVVKPKPHLKKPVAVVKPSDADAPDRDADAAPDSHGLSREQVAEQLGKKLADAGVKDETKVGVSGAANSQANSFADFYAMIHDQVMDKWQHPSELQDNIVDPVVQIHVEKDGRVPPESVTLVKSSGDQACDDSALTAAKNLGNLLQPLPDGCPPDISITFKLTH